MSDLTKAQRRALDIIAERGFVGPGNGIRLETVRVLERLGKVTVESQAVSQYNRRSGRTHHDVDWVARMAKPVESKPEPQPGAYCPTAAAIVPLYDGTLCDWCGKHHDIQYVYIEKPAALRGWHEKRKQP